MELNITGQMRKVCQVVQHELTDILKTSKNIMIFGPSGYGKTAKIRDYCNEIGKNLRIISLAMELPENIGGIPYVKTDSKAKTQYFTRLLDEQLTGVFENEGENVVIFFDEINQAPAEVLNALYGICHPNPKERNWAGHSLAKAQIVAAGNLDDGSDGTTYLTPLPTPLLNRFFVCELKPSREDTFKYLQATWKNIPEVKKYLEPMLDANIPPRDIEQILDLIAYHDANGKLMEMKLGSALTTELLDIKKHIVVLDPTEKLKRATRFFKLYRKNGNFVEWPTGTITSDEELKRTFIDEYGLTKEEVASIFKSEK